MIRFKSQICRFAALLTIGFMCSSAFAAEQPKTDTVILKPASTVAIVGDSITEQKHYSRFIEAYLLACRPDLKLKVIQFGWGGERAPAFLGRMDNDMMPFKPDLVTLCYGMNDGNYSVYNENTGKVYETAMRGIVQKLKDRGITVIVGTPGCVDSDNYKRPPTAAVYNETLKTLAGIDSKIAKDFSMPFADLNSVFTETMKNAKAAYGNTYHVAGTDGVHPALNGQLIMAYAFLKTMGFDGNIGTLTVDFNGKAEGDIAHKILSFKDGKLDVESSRYPFCFYGEDKNPIGTKSILPYLPFNQDLNRFTLVVKNIPSDKAEVKWGSDKKTFTKEQLEKGINLADEFLNNPFSPKFSEFLNLLMEKQIFETSMIKRMMTNMPVMIKDSKNDKDLVELTDSLKKRLIEIENNYNKKVSDFIVPFKHQIEITPVK